VDARGGDGEATAAQGCTAMLHPGQRGRFLWDLLGMLFLCYDVVSIPFQAAFNPPAVLFDHILNWSILFFWTFDVLKSCSTGYYVQGTLVTQPTAVLLHYGRTWMLPDIAIITLDWVMVILNSMSADGSRKNASKVLRTLKVVRMVRMLRLLRLLKLRRLLQEFHEHINSESFSIILSLATLVIFLIAVNHFIACLWYAVGTAELGGPSWVEMHDLQETTIMYRYLTSLHWAFTNIASSMEVRPYNVTERLFAVVVLIIGVILSSAFLGSITGSMLQLWTLWNEERRQFWLLRRYLRDANISISLAMRVERYLDFIWRREKNHVEEEQVSLLGRLSEPLRNELKHESFAPHLKSHALFAALCDRTKVFLKICTARALAPGDFHFNCGEEADSMTFITSGSLQYVRGLEVEPPQESEETNQQANQQQGAAFQQVGEGEWIAEATLWVEWLHLGDIVAETVCQLITIDRTFADAILCNAQVAGMVQLYAQRFALQLAAIAHEDLSDLLERLFPAADTFPPCLLRHCTEGGPMTITKSISTFLSEAQVPTSQSMTSATSELWEDGRDDPAEGGNHVACIVGQDSGAPEKIFSKVVPVECIRPDRNMLAY